ncbi:conserved Plasmodium protein, unknown function [Plasmodium ovale wallikeri]|uniref:Uncharacterized protein n=1 Tax=Plasmodium ovale wallikeri TaxID=864142 RepID=A0A1A8ZCB3_PLAOA|nr:conserved Plasmodium protein, unknown function [Plasmodium ovale wallikeri]
MDSYAVRHIKIEESTQCDRKLPNFNTNVQKGVKNEISKDSEVHHVAENIDPGNAVFKYCAYLKPMEIKGIKRADRKFDYNSSYSFMLAQKDFSDDLNNKSFFTKCLYNGMKVPLPPKRYKIAEYVKKKKKKKILNYEQVILFVWSVPQAGSGH